MKTASLLKIFLAASIMYVLLLLLGYQDYDFFVKPLLVPILISAVWASDSFATKKLLMGVLFLSWLGDLSLMSNREDSVFFLLGLLFFVISHLGYIAIFLKQPKIVKKSNRIGFLIGLLGLVGYIAGLMYLLIPQLGNLVLPVLGYTLVVAGMLLVVLWRLPVWPTSAAYFMLAGTMCFVVSDSLLAFNKFYEPLPLAAFDIMSTYLAAQFLIVYGILVLNKKQHSLMSENAAI